MREQKNHVLKRSGNLVVPNVTGGSGSDRRLMNTYIKGARYTFFLRNLLVRRGFLLNLKSYFINNMRHLGISKDIVILQRDYFVVDAQRAAQTETSCRCSLLGHRLLMRVF